MSTTKRQEANNTPPKSRPNVIVILADDLGYSDLGVYGSDISTPNLDRLARNGVRLTHFHSAPSCSPTRSMLLSGTNNHMAGVGAMKETLFAMPQLRGQWGYEGILTNRVATVAERLREIGYATLMAGKWHLGMAADEIPSARGFDHSFALLQGAANHFGLGGFAPNGGPMTDATYLDDGNPFTPGPDFYSSDSFTDHLIAQIDATPANRPVFAYLAFSAPHLPLMAPANVIRKYRGRYDGGWDRLRESRLAGMARAGVLPGVVLPGGDAPSQTPWERLTPEQRHIEARKMEIYAAMIERLDWNIGRLLDRLKADGRLDNTLILFMSDNGPAGETVETFSILRGVKEGAAAADNSLNNMGSGSSFVLLGPNWARAIAAPSRLFKGFVTEGGTLIPVIAWWPGHLKSGANAVPGDVRDILPTVFDAIGASLSPKVAGRDVAPVEGRSLLSYLESGKSDRPIEDIALELHGQASVRRGNWKMLRMPPQFGDGHWELYDLSHDPGEKHNLAGQRPDLVDSMRAAWLRFAETNKIVDMTAKPVVNPLPDTPVGR